MKNYRKLGIILILVVSLPALFFSVYEIGSLSKNEEIIEEIYNNQLEVILTSVNQYSDDVAESWVFNIKNIMSVQQYPNFGMQAFMSNYPSILGFFYSRDTLYNNIYLVTQNNREFKGSGKNLVATLMRNNNAKTKKLFTYFRARYPKIEPISSPQIKGISYFTFIAKDFNGIPVVCGMIIDSKEFVKQVIAPKIEMMVKEKFIVDIRSGNKTVYSSESLGFKQASRTKSLWLLPELTLGVVYKGKTIQELVRERTYVNFGLIFIFDFLILIGIWFVFKSFKTEFQLARMRSDFISNVSHEIRTPLALLSVYTESILLGRYKPEKLAEYHNILHQETNRLIGIVNKILNFSKIEEKKYQYNYSSLSINELVEDVLERFNYHLNNVGFHIEKSLSANLPQLVADREALNEVLTNLVDNAIKYSGEIKYLGISTFLVGDKIVLTITDKGIGIPEEQKKYVFDKFYRGGGSEVHNIKGSGLGLAIVKHIVEGHGGTITIESEQPEGTSFKIILPVNVKRDIK